jgi:hypothetical protein
MTSKPIKEVLEGILNPSPDKVEPGKYLYRLGSTTQKERWFSGPWWFEYEALVLMKEFAEDTGLGLSYCGRAYLAIAYEWNTKCNVLVRAQVTSQLGVWAGEGLTIKDKGAPEGVRLWRPPPVIKQIYIPGLSSRDSKQREIWRDAFSYRSHEFLPSTIV